jgi:nitroreductase
MDMISVGACIENMLLSATSLNLGSLWIGSITNFEEEISSLLNINNLHLISAIALGYKNEEPSPRPRKLLDEVLEWR